MFSFLVFFGARCGLETKMTSLTGEPTSKVRKGIGSVGASLGLTRPCYGIA